MENLQEMIDDLNSEPKKNEEENIDNLEVSENTESDNKEVEDNIIKEQPEIGLVNFYDWFESVEAEVIHNVARVKATVSNVDSKDSIIFKIQKGTDPESMELISFYNPSSRPILNLPPIYMKVYKNDTFEVLHTYNDEIFIKSYGVKTGLIVVFCANVDGKVIPYEKIKIKKNVDSIKLHGHEGISDEIKNKLKDPVDVETIQLLYKQAEKFKDVFVTKEDTVNWFLKKQSEVVDINHLLKIDNVLINII